MEKKDLEEVLERKVEPLLEDALKTHLGFSIDKLKEDLAGKIKHVPFLEIDIDTSLPFHASKENFLSKFLTRMLSIHLGNVAETAKAAHIERRSLHRFIAKCNIPIDSIRKDLVKKTYIHEQHISQAITSTLDNYKNTIHPKKIETLSDYTRTLSKDIAKEVTFPTMTMHEAERMFESYYFKDVLGRTPTITALARHASLRPETVHRKLKALGLTKHENH